MRESQSSQKAGFPALGPPPWARHTCQKSVLLALNLEVEHRASAWPACNQGCSAGQPALSPQPWYGSRFQASQLGLGGCSACAQEEDRQGAHKGCLTFIYKMIGG